MKRFWLSLIVLCGLLVAVSSLSSTGVADKGNPPDVETAKSSGMPGRPLPARPIPHHEPGHLPKAANYSTTVTRMRADGIRETVELQGLEAMLAEGAISDPFAGNYTFVELDQIMVASNDAMSVTVESLSAFEAPDVLTTPTLISGSLVTIGSVVSGTAPSIASGDLNGDGQAEQIVAWIGSDGEIRLSINELPGWQGKLTSDPAAMAHDDGRMDLLVRGYDDALWHRHYDGATWEEWNSNAGGYLRSGPALAFSGDGEFDVFVAGVYSGTGVVYTATATSICQRHWDGTAWSADWDLVDVDPADGLALVGEPAATARGTDQIDLFRRASDNTLRWLHYDGASWGEWQNLGGLITSAPTAVSLGADHLHVFARGFDGMLWHRALGGTLWSPWRRLAGFELTSRPTAVSPASNQIDVYARGTDDALWRNRLNGSAWLGWESLGGVLGSAAAATVHGTQVDLFAQTTPTATLQHKHYDGSAWTDWQDRGGLTACCTTYNTGVSADVVAVETGYFTGDGREQIVMAYNLSAPHTNVRLYDVNDGFKPRLLADCWFADESTKLRL
ncbi:MAG: hypothetical protein PVF45_07165, partial [Anaerolineae bacterium]